MLLLRKASRSPIAPLDAAVAALMKSSDALVIPAVGPKLAPDLFEGASLKLVQVTGAGIDRLDQPSLTRLGIPVANVQGGSNNAVAEYTVAAASMLLRRFAWADAEIKAGDYAKFRASVVAEIWLASRVCRLVWSDSVPSAVRWRRCSSASVRRSVSSTRRPPIPMVSTRKLCHWTSCLRPPMWCRCTCRCCPRRRT